MSEIQLTLQKKIPDLVKQAADIFENSSQANVKLKAVKVPGEASKEAQGKSIQAPQMELVAKLGTNFNKISQLTNQVINQVERIQVGLKKESQETDLLQKNKTSHKRGHGMS